MGRQLKRRLTLGCSLVALGVMFAASGRSGEHPGHPLEPATALRVSFSGVQDSDPHWNSGGLGGGSDLPSSHPDILNDDDGAEDFEFRIDVGQTREFTLTQPRADGLSDAGHTTLACRRCTRISILRC